MPMIAPDLSFHMHGSSVTIEARISATRPRSLDWALSVRSVTAGGSNVVNQSGRTDGAHGAPVAVVGLAAKASGHLILVVREAGVVVAQRSCDFSPAGSQCVDQPPAGAS